MESEKMYDSTRDTDIHKDNIQYVWSIIKKYMQYKIDHHDDSKYMDPEKPVYDKYIPLLRKYKYGTPEYKKVREEMERDGLTHHYAANRHHPEHFEDGIAGMDLFDFLEHVVDCYASSLVSDTSFRDGLEKNAERFGYPEELLSILRHTAGKLEVMDAVSEGRDPHF